MKNIVLLTVRIIVVLATAVQLLCRYFYIAKLLKLLEKQQFQDNWGGYGSRNGGQGRSGHQKHRYFFSWPNPTLSKFTG